MSIAITVQKKIADGRTDRQTDRHTDLSINYIGTRADARRVIHVAAIYIIILERTIFPKNVVQFGAKYDHF